MNKKYRITVVCMFIFCLFTTFLCQSTAYSQISPSPQVILIMSGHLSLEDIHRAESREQNAAAFSRAVLGEMNMRTQAGMQDIHNAVTISAGARAVGSEWTRQAFDIGRQSRMGFTIYQQLSGKNPLSTGSAGSGVLFPYVDALIQKNRADGTGAVPGLLGDTLKRRGVPRAAIGNGDSENRISRLAPILVMDREGFVPEGKVDSDSLQDAPYFPGGKKSNYAFMETQINQWSAHGIRVIAVELGDLTRLEVFRDRLGSQRYAKHREQCVDEMLQFVNRIAAQQPAERKILLFSSSLPGEAVQAKKLMGPVLLVNNAGHGKGVLCSATTRQPGIIANVDLTLSVLNWLHAAPPPGMKGQPLTESFAVTHEDFWRESKRIDIVYANRPGVLYPYTVTVLFVILAASFYLLLVQRNKFPAATAFFKSILLLSLPALLLVPFLFLLLPFFFIPSSAVTTVVVVAGASLLFALLLGRAHFAVRFFCIGLLNWLPLLVDGMEGGALIRRSYLGYDPVIGARYYGIGNEYMGVIVGATLLSLSLAAQACRSSQYRKQKGCVFWAVAGVVFLLQILYMAWPGGGAKAGGVIVLLICYAYYVLCYVKISPSWKRRGFIGVGCSIILISILLFMMNDRVSAERQSHVGRAVHELTVGNWAEIGRITRRKIHMNFRLTLHSPWSKVFLAGLGIIAWLLARQAARIRVIAEAKPDFMKGVRAIVLGSLAALLVNDSGIIAAALAIMYAVIPLLYMLVTQHSAK